MQELELKLDFSCCCITLNININHEKIIFTLVYAWYYFTVLPSNKFFNSQ
jgi:hypothetical protein